MTQATYRTNIRSLLGDSEYDAALINQAVNWMVSELCNNNRLRIMEASEEITAASASTELEFPEDMVTLIDFWTTSPQVINLRNNRVEYIDFMANYANFASAPSAQARSWTDFGNKARFAAPLSADHTFQIDYLREPVAMTRDNDECEIPDRYSELVTKGAFARVLEVNEDYDEATIERDNYAPLLTTFIRNESRGSLKVGPTIMRAGRGRGRGSYRVDRDF